MTIRTREKDVFIEANKWLSEKTRLPLKLTDRRFHSAARPQNVSAERVPRETGELLRFHSAATDRRIGPDMNRGTTAVSFDGFRTADQTAELTREIKSIRYERQFHWAARPSIQTAVSPILVKPKAFSNGDLRAKNKHTRCMRGLFRTTTGNELHDT